MELVQGCKGTKGSKSTKHKTLSFMNRGMAPENRKVVNFR